jgi:(p)ppGpp synthase/HD superfamily hydrolase
MKPKPMTLDAALAMAAKAHAGQKDRYGKPYILHPLRVMLRCRTEEEMLAAILHDVVEDTPLALADLKAAGCPARVLKAVDCLSRRDGETYGSYLRRVKTNRIAMTVKLADLDDNSDPSRLLRASKRDARRLGKYRRARRFLMS